MKNITLSVVLALFFLFPFRFYANSPDCGPVIEKLARGKKQVDLSSNPVALITAEEALVKTGPIYKRWDSDLQTSVYSSMAEPNKDGSVPLVDKNAKAVLIFFHGSGTAKASGKNFAENMNVLRPAGIAGVSLDLPFHGENKGSISLNNMDNFMKWINQFVTKVKKEANSSGKKIPIYMVGHSFGPSVIQEYIERYPKDVDDFLLMSPAGDFHPALKYTYEKITVPGEKYLGGEPVIENAAGGEWAGQLEGQFTWHTRPPFSTRPGKMLIGALDEWWPGNKELAQKVGVEQPFEFKEPLEYMQKKYPKMDITVVPNYGHMIFEATAPNGRNLIREKIFDMLGVAEKDRTPPGVPVSPREKIALLYQTSPLFREWLGARYPHSFDNDIRSNGVLADWENVKYQAWRKVLERISEEHPDFAKARGFSLAIAKQKATGKVPVQDPVTTKLQYDLVGFLSGNDVQKSEILSKPDTEYPKPLKLQPSSYDKGWAPIKSGATGPLLKDLFLEKINAKGASKITTTSAGEGLVKVSYEVEGKNYENTLLDYTPQQVESIVNDLYVQAYEINNYANPGDTVEIVRNGIKWKFAAKDKHNVTSLQISQ